MKFLIVGYGSIGRRHLRNLRELGYQEILLLRSHQSTLPDDEIAELPIACNLSDALNHQPDGVIIANPTALHLDVAIPAAQNGCAILMEKPISSDLARIAELREALKNNQSRLLMGFQYRFHPGLVKVKQLIEMGKIGRPLSYRAEWGEYIPDWHPWEDYRKSYAARADLGGGVALTLCHPLDWGRWLFGEFQTIWGFNAKVSDLEIAVDDLAEIGLQYQNGVVGSIHLDYYRRNGVNQLEICGTEGTLRWTNDDAIVKVRSGNSSTEEVHSPVPEFERNLLFLEEMRHFTTIVSGSQLPLITIEDGIIALQMVAALKKSWAEQRFLHYDEVIRLES